MLQIYTLKNVEINFSAHKGFRVRRRLAEIPQKLTQSHFLDSQTVVRAPYVCFEGKKLPHHFSE